MYNRYVSPIWRTPLYSPGGTLEKSRPEPDELDVLRARKQAGELPSHFSYVDSRAAVPVIAVVIMIYAILGGLKAAAITDFIQGVLIIVLSFIIIPFGLSETGWFSGLHERVPEHMFNLLGSPQTSDYSLLFIVSIILVNLVGIVVQPHMMQVCGSARDENAARVGFTYGNYLKRVCTIGWALVGCYLVYALYAQRGIRPGHGLGLRHAQAAARRAGGIDDRLDAGGDHVQRRRVHGQRLGAVHDESLPSACGQIAATAIWSGSAGSPPRLSLSAGCCSPRCCTALSSCSSISGHCR